jgi:hypothetical protein
MSNSPISPRLAKGAFIEFSNRFTHSIPNLIVFQYNPESITRKLAGWKDETATDKTKATPTGQTAQPFDPDETLTFKLEFDAADVLDQPLLHPLAVISGVTDRIAAIEMLMYPQEDTTVGSLLKSAASTLGSAAGSAAGVGFAGGAIGATAGGLISQKTQSASSLKVPRGTVPTVLLVMSPGRIVPVRITDFSVEEKDFTPNLYVLRASLTMTLKIIAPKEMPCKKTDADKKAVTAYNIYQRQKRDFAAANIASTIEYAASDITSTIKSLL